MIELLDWLDCIEDIRQTSKVRHKLKDILVNVLLVTLAGTECRVRSMISSEILQQLYGKWQELLKREEGELLKKIICIAGKTMRSNGTKQQRANHVISVWSKEDGYCLGQKIVEEKSNEITAIPKLLEQIQIKGQVVTIDAMGTQMAIAEQIRKKRTDYMLVVKKNQGNLYENIMLYFGEEEKKRIKEEGNYKKTIENVHEQLEIREYYQNEDIKWILK